MIEHKYVIIRYPKLYVKTIPFSLVFKNNASFSPFKIFSLRSISIKMQ